MRQNDLWLSMLTAYTKRMRYVAITIPCMVAAYHKAGKDIDLNSSQCVKTILNDIVESQSNKRVLIQKCQELQHYVLSIFWGIGGPSIGDRIYFNMYDKTFETDCGYSIDGVSEILYDMYKEPIRSKLFSYNKYEDKWQELSDTESSVMDEILMNIEV